MRAVISLQERGLIKPVFYGVAVGDGTSSFEVPLDVWKELLDSESFLVTDTDAWTRLLNGDQSHETMHRALPRGHPAVAYAIENRDF